MLKSEFETSMTPEGEEFFQSEKDKAGFVMFGPYELYQPGTYSVTLTILAEKTDDNQSDASGQHVLCGYVEITTSYGTVVLERTNLYIDRLLRKDSCVALSFELQEPRELEFRVFSTGKTRLKVLKKADALPIQTKGFNPVLAPDALVTNEFFAVNFPQFRNLYEHGVDIAIVAQGAIATCGGISFNLRTMDDLQIVHEIFLLREYDVSLGRDTLAVDVGMNVGLTSLYLARNPHVTEVHSFEPFQHPFTRAQENFKLNPELSKKIFPTKVGLSSTDQKLSVLSNTDSPIGTSIKGRSTGDLETIDIREASPIFNEILSRARSKGWEVVVKIDCEGSEFAIIESLAAAKLLTGIRVIMIEWHKWWSAHKSQADLVRPLLENGFVVFDRTVASNQWAGMLFAVRMSGLND